MMTKNNKVTESKVTEFIEASNLLGEGPLWAADQQALYWVDIESCQLHQYKDEKRQVWQFEKKVTAVCQTNRGELVLAFADGVALFNTQTEVVKYITKIDEDFPENRTNDAKCDANGNFWVGTMCDDETTPVTTGRLWRVDGYGNKVKILENLGIANTFAWDLERKKFYFADSSKGTIYKFDYDAKTDVISNQNTFITSKQGSAPDGSCIDKDGYIWNCQWDGWRIVRYNPNGEVDIEIELPVQRPTSCTFGGSDLKTLYITTASINLTDAELKQQPLAGSILALNPADYGIETSGFEADRYKILS